MSSPYSFGLTVQQLRRRSEQVLVLAQLQVMHSGRAWFRPADLISLFREFHIPSPGNLNQVLADMARGGLLSRGARPGEWGVTPLGQSRIPALGVSLDVGAVEREVNKLPRGAFLAKALHAVVPPFMAPPQWVHGIGRFLDRHPFEFNVFCMTRFPRTEEDAVLASAIAVSREALKAHRLELHRADDRQIEDDVQGNVAAFMWSCMYGLGFFERRTTEALNHNLVIEVGSMLMTGRRCALLKDASDADLHMPTDFVGEIYKEIDLADQFLVADTVHRWVAEDLGLGRCDDCPADGARRQTA